MNFRSCSALALAALTISIAGQADVPPIATPVPQQFAPGAWMVYGSMLPEREPDGNTVIFDAKDGLSVVDTGRHLSHRNAILGFARSHGKRIAVIINSHWHLDHVSGNPDLRAAFPGLRVYASDAIGRALPGFLASSAKDGARYVDDPKIPDGLRDDIRGDLATIAAGPALKPDIVIARSAQMTLAGLALAQVAASQFKIAVPGHGAPMTKSEFLTYRRAFTEFIGCAGSRRPKDQCAAGWVNSIGSLLGVEPHAQHSAAEIAADYVGMLRANGGRSRYCEAPAAQLRNRTDGRALDS